MSKSESIMRSLFDDLDPEPDPLWGTRLQELARERDRMNQKPYGRQDRPTTQEPITFSVTDARAARDEAIERVEINADEQWKQTFYNCLVNVAVTTQTFNADDVWQNLAKLPKVPHTTEARAAGPVIMKAQRNGVIRLRPNEFAHSRRKHCHRMLIRVYDSLVYGKQPHEIPAYA